jgi:hypothetical protein
MIEEEIVKEEVHFVIKAEVEMQMNWWRFSAASLLGFGCTGLRHFRF